MSHITILILRTILMYAVIFVTMRIMGKREIGKLSIFDLAISIMIAEIAAFVLEDVNKPIWEGLAPIIVLVGIQVGLAYLGLKFRNIRLLADGKPSILVSKGKLHRKEMARLRYNLDDLMQQLRGKDIDSLADVEFAILETTGQLTIIPKDKEDAAGSSASSSGSDDQGGVVVSGSEQDSSGSSNTASRSDAEASVGGSQQGISGSNSNPSSSGSGSSTSTGGASSGNGNGQTMSTRSASQEAIIDIPYHKVTYEGMPIPLIMDGKVQDENLKLIDKNRPWLQGEIRKYGFNDFEDVFLCSIDHKGRIYLDGKEQD
ncbi:YetF domain-containing protein [Paenibacillus lactis]|uniref:YetF domain-containing protein n=1 Tax=Paenibacillus lactis TaxID=228574 RepID=UPI0036913C49